MAAPNMEVPQDSVPSRAFGPVESADETRQAQHQVANDTPMDVNFNALVGRSQALTVAQAGRDFTSNAARRQIIADLLLMPKG